MSFNWRSVFYGRSVTGIIAAPATMLLIAGQFDLSVGSAAAFCGAVLASLALHNDIYYSVVIAVLAGVGIGVLNGFLVTVIGMEGFAYAAHRWVMHGWGWFLHASHHTRRHLQHQ